MKKTLLIWMLTFVLLLSGVIASITLTEIDNFDRSNRNLNGDNGWTTGNEGASDTVDILNQRARFIDGDSNSLYADKSITWSGENLTFVVEASQTNHHGTLWFFDGGTYLFGVTLDASGQISARDGSTWSVLDTYNIGTNYTILLYNINMTDDTYRVAIDGVPLNGVLDFWNAGSDINSLRIEGGSSSTGTFYYDTIALSEGQEDATVSEVNDSTESTAVVKQVGSISFGGGPASTIFSSDFNVSVDNTPLYGGYTFQVASNGNNGMFCELLINGTSYANVTRTQYSGETAGNVYIMFPTTIIPNNGNYNQELQCSRTSGTGLITISNAVGVGHFLIDQDGEFINYNSSTISTTVTSGSSYTLLKSLNIIISNKTNTSAINPRKNHIVIDGAFTYTNNGGSAETPSIYANVNGTNCTILPRTVSSGGIGSVSYDCNVFNVTENEVYQIDFYGNGTNILYEGDVTAKNFFLSNNEIIGGTGILKGATFSGNTYTTLISNVSGGNNNHDLANVFNKLSFAITTDTDTTVSIYFNITNGGEYLTNVWQRNFVAGETGVMIGQDVIEGLPKDDYNVSLHANCGTVGATCTISGGQTGGYLTDVITTITNSFDITSYNFWNNNSLNDFNVTDGATVTSVNGTATYFSTNDFENLTISANNYFDTYVENHNTSQNLNVSMKQSDIKFRATQILNNKYVSPANFTINGITKSINESFYLAEGTYNITFSKNEWYNKTQEITINALDNKTINITSVSNAIINITGIINISNATTPLNGWFYTQGYNQTVIVPSTGLILNWLSGETTYNLGYEIDGISGYRKEVTATQTFNNGTNNLTIVLQPDNLHLQFGTSVEGWLIHDLNSQIPKDIEFNDTEFLIVQNSLAQGRVLIRFNSISYTNQTQYYEYDNNWTYTISETFGLLNQSKDLKDYWIEIRNEDNEPVEGATVRLLQNRIGDGNGTAELISQRIVDSNGQTYILANTDTEITLIVSKEGYNIGAQVYNVIDENTATKESPLIIQLTYSKSGYDGKKQIKVPTYYENSSNNINGIRVVAWGNPEIKYMTDYKGINYTVSTNAFAYRDIELIAGVDFPSGTTNPINLTIWIANTKYEFQITDYKQSIHYVEEKDLFKLSNLNSNLLGIALILFSFMAGILFKGEAGYNTFGIGSVALAFINPIFIIVAIPFAIEIGVKKLSNLWGDN